MFTQDATFYDMKNAYPLKETPRLLNNVKTNSREELSVI